jgi:hypothetical protein
MLAYRHAHTATLLTDGRVLVAGGRVSSTPTGNISSTATTELTDATGTTFAAGPAMFAPRDNHTATLLADGRVLLVGGDAPNRMTAELYVY